MTSHKKNLASVSLTLVLAAIIFSVPWPSVATDSLPNITIPSLEISIPNVTFSNVKCAPGATCDIPWLSQYIQGTYKYGIGAIGLLATVVMMIGGLQWMMSAGDSSKVSSARGMIISSVTGLAIAMSSYLILNTVNKNLVISKPLSLSTIKEDILPKDITYTSGGGQNSINKDVSTYDKLLLAEAEKRGLDCDTLKAFMMTESSGNPNAESPVGAQGLMQVMPATAAELGYSGNLKDPATSIAAGAAYIAKLRKNACNGSTSNANCDVKNFDYVIAAYNGGPKANKESVTCSGLTYWQCEANEGYAQTRNYVKKVNANIEKLRSTGWGCTPAPEPPTTSD